MSFGVYHSVSEAWIGAESLPEFFKGCEFVGLLGDGVEAFLLNARQFLRGLGRHGLAAGVTDRLVTRDIRATTRAGDRCRGIGFVLFRYVHSVRAGDFALGVPGEHGNISSGGARAPDPSVMVFEMSLVDVPGGEEGGAGLPEVRERDGPGDSCPLSHLPEGFVCHFVGDGLRLREFRPQRRIAIGPVGWVVAQPVIEIRRPTDERHSSPAHLPVDCNLKPVLVVLDVANSQVLEFATTQPGVELHRRHRRVAVVVGGVDHLQDVLPPVEHLPRVRRRVVVGARSGRHPGQRDGYAVAVGLDVLTGLRDSLAENSEHGSVIPVRLLVIVATVDPADDILGSVLRVDGFVELPVPFGHSSSLSQDCLVTSAAILLREQAESIVEGQEGLAIVLADFIGLPDAFAEVGYLRPVVPRHTFSSGGAHHNNSIAVALNLGFTAHPWLKSSGSTSNEPEIGTFGDSSTVGPGFSNSGASGGVGA